MRFITFIASLFFCSVALGESKVLQAPDPDSKKYHELALHIPESGTIKYQIRRVADTKNNGSGPQIVAKYAYSSAYRLRDDHYIFLPKLISSDLESINGSPPPLGLNPQMILAGLVLMDGVEYSTDETLAPDTINNMTALKSNYRKMMAAAEKASGGNANDAKIDSAINAVFSNFDESSATEIFMVEQTLLGLIHGAGLELGRPSIILVDEPGAISGVPVKMRHSLSLESWDPKKNMAVANATNEIDPEYLKEYVSQVVPRMMATQGATPPTKDQLQAMMASAQFSNSTNCRYEIVISTGLISKADCTVIKGTTIEGKGQMKTDQYTIQESLE